MDSFRLNLDARPNVQNGWLTGKSFFSILNERVGGMSSLLAKILTDSFAYLPEKLRAEWARLFHPQLIDTLASRLQCFHQCGVLATPPEPYFAAEITLPLTPAFAPFQTLMGAGTERELTPAELQSWADVLVEAGIDSILRLLGQRVTPGSLTDHRGIPPARDVLIASAHAPHLPGEKLTVAARALAKHAPRSFAPIWGAVEGNDADKNAASEQVVSKILDGATWWNVFGHYVHDTVFEARLPSGHGVRWGREGTVFIGFLEPFLEGGRLKAEGA